MNRNAVSEKRRITAGIMGLMILVFLFFSVFYIVTEADHECCGEDCPVCACIQLCERAVREAGTGALPAASANAFAAMFSFLLLQETVILIFRLQETPVFRRVRMNN